MSSGKLFIVASNAIEDRSEENEEDYIHLDEEIREIQDAIHKAVVSQQISVHQRWAARPKELVSGLLDERPDIVHITGHGGDGYIFLQNKYEIPLAVEKKNLLNLFKKDAFSPKVLILNSCLSKSTAKALSAVIPVCIGTSGKINPWSAKLFSGYFYRAIANGCSIKDAFDAAIAGLKLEEIDQSHLFHIFEQNKGDANNLVPVRESKTLLNMVVDVKFSLNMADLYDLSFYVVNKGTSPTEKFQARIYPMNNSFDSTELVPENPHSRRTHTGAVIEDREEFYRFNSHADEMLFPNQSIKIATLLNQPEMTVAFRYEILLGTEILSDTILITPETLFRDYPELLKTIQELKQKISLVNNLSPDKVTTKQEIADLKDWWKKVRTFATSLIPNRITEIDRFFANLFVPARRLKDFETANSQSLPSKLKNLIDSEKREAERIVNHNRRYLRKLKEELLSELDEST